MKRFIYSLLFLASLAIVSCAKQEVRPTKSMDVSDSPVWRSAGTGNRSGDNSGVVLEGEGILDPNEPEGVVNGVDSDINGIVDPNDLGSGKKGKQ